MVAVFVQLFYDVFIQTSARFMPKLNGLVEFFDVIAPKSGGQGV